jgi:hypothetical protein
MPMFEEVGPLVVDPAVEQELSKLEQQIEDTRQVVMTKLQVDNITH